MMTDRPEIEQVLHDKFTDLVDAITDQTDMDAVKTDLYARMRARHHTPSPAAPGISGLSDATKARLAALIRAAGAQALRDRAARATPEPADPVPARSERPLSEVRFLTVAETAAVLEVDKLEIYRRVHSGELPAIRVGRSVRIPEQALGDPRPSTPATGEPAAPAPARDERPLSQVQLLTVAQAAALMNVSKMTIYRLVHSGELPAVRTGRSFRIPDQAIRDYAPELFTQQPEPSHAVDGCH